MENWKKDKMKNEHEVFEWWMEEKNIEGQMSLDDYNYEW